MRACFLGQNICALGYGVALVQSPPLDDGAPGEGPLGEAGPLQIPPGAPQQNPYTTPSYEALLTNRMFQALRAKPP